MTQISWATKLLVGLLLLLAAAMMIFVIALDADAQIGVILPPCVGDDCHPECDSTTPEDCEQDEDSGGGSEEEDATPENQQSNTEAPVPIQISLSLQQGSLSREGNVISLCYELTNEGEETAYDISVKFLHSPFAGWYGIGGHVLHDPWFVDELAPQEVVTLCIQFTVTSEEVEKLQQYLDTYHNGIEFTGLGLVWANATSQASYLGGDTSELTDIN